MVSIHLFVNSFLISSLCVVHCGVRAPRTFLARRECSVSICARKERGKERKGRIQKGRRRKGGRLKHKLKPKESRRLVFRMVWFVCAVGKGQNQTVC